MLERPANDAPSRLIRDCRFGAERASARSPISTNARSATGPGSGRSPRFRRGSKSGLPCKVQSHSFVCTGVRIGNGVFIGHGVIFVNDKRPRATNPDRSLQAAGDWKLLPISIADDATIGSGAIILGGVNVGSGAMIGAGAIVAEDVADGAHRPRGAGARAERLARPWPSAA